MKGLSLCKPAPQRYRALYLNQSRANGVREHPHGVAPLPLHQSLEPLLRLAPIRAIRTGDPVTSFVRRHATAGWPAAARSGSASPANRHGRGCAIRACACRRHSSSCAGDPSRSGRARALSRCSLARNADLSEAESRPCWSRRRV